MDTFAAEAIKKAYGKKEIIKNISLKINSGEIIGLLGPNGAGKTTCFYIMVGLIPLDYGKISLNGEDISTKPMHERAKLGIGYLPQEASIFRKLTVKENLLAVLELQKLNKQERENKLNKLLDDFKISHIANNLGISLSGGERRRVEIARAVAANPKFILLDEPFAGVDPVSIIDIKQIIMQLVNNKIGILITDHNVRDTLSICNKAYIVGDGQVLAYGNSEEILDNKRVREIYLGENFII